MTGGTAEFPRCVTGLERVSSRQSLLFWCGAPEGREEEPKRRRTRPRSGKIFTGPPRSGVCPGMDARSWPGLRSGRRAPVCCISPLSAQLESRGT